MREIRIFELEHGEPVETWRLAQAMQLHVSEGEHASAQLKVIPEMQDQQ